MKSMLKDAAILFVITLFAGLILGAVYQVTKEPIALAEEKAAKEDYGRNAGGCKVAERLDGIRV